MIIERPKSARGIMALLLSFVLLSACSSLKKTPASSLLTSKTGATIEQKGAVEIPARQSSEETVTEIPLSANSQVSIVAATEYKPAELRVTFTAPAILKHTQAREQATAAKTVAPPSPREMAAANALETGSKTFYIIGGILFVLALALVYFQHVKAAGFAFLGSFLAPVLANLAGSQFALIAVAVTLTASLALFVAWYLMKHKGVIGSA